MSACRFSVNSGSFADFVAQQAAEGRIPPPLADLQRNEGRYIRGAGAGKAKSNKASSYKYVRDGDKQIIFWTDHSTGESGTFFIEDSPWQPKQQPPVYIPHKCKAEQPKPKLADDPDRFHRRWLKILDTYDEFPPGNHPYLVKKRIEIHSARHVPLNHTGKYVVNNRLRGALAIPVTDLLGNLKGIQYIRPDGSKDKPFHKGTAKKGNCNVVTPSWGFEGKLLSCDVVVLAEGFATAASVAEHLYPLPDENNPERPVALVLAALDAGNLEPVARAVRAAYGSEKPIHIIADNDTNGTGQKRAREAAEAVGALIRTPKLSGADANDILSKKSPEPSITTAGGKETTL